jgi:3,4-dihydroxy 2-butanone 4-phosphate synthase
MNALKKAIEEFRNGKCILLYDWPEREDEVDMVYYAGSIDEHKIYELRTVAGGLICFGTTADVVNVLGLRLLSDLLATHETYSLLNKRPRYGDLSPFVLWVSSVDVRIGISDRDRALTISKLHKVVTLIESARVEEARQLFYEGFYAPGHVPILAARCLKVRKGHTELAVSLAKLAGLVPSVVFAEMLNKGSSMSFNEAKRFAEERGLTLLTGEDVLNACESEVI